MLRPKGGQAQDELAGADPADEAKHQDEVVKRPLSEATTLPPLCTEPGTEDWASTALPEMTRSPPCPPASPESQARTTQYTLRFPRLHSRAMVRWMEVSIKIFPRFVTK